MEQKDDESDEAYVKRINQVYWPEDNAPNEEDGLVYTVAQTLHQIQNFLAGFQVGIYHDRSRTLSHKCMGIDMTEHIKFILMIVLKPTNILHLLDLIKFTGKSSEVIHHTFEYCGYKDTMHDLTVFCSLDGLDELKDWKKCSPQTILTNIWWRQPVLFSQFIRVQYNLVEVIQYALNKKQTGQMVASQKTASTLFDMGDDIGTMARYILDFHLVEKIDIGDWD